MKEYTPDRKPAHTGTSHCLHRHLKGILLRSPGIQQDWTTVPQQPQELQPSPHISVITEAVLHQLPSDHTNPRYPEPLLGAQLAPFPLSWPRPPALPTWTICPLWKNASFLTLTSLLMCRPLMNWELHEPGISVKNVPDRGSPSPETLVPTQYHVFLQSVWPRFSTVRFTYSCS